MNGTDSGGAVLTYSATGLPAGLSIDSATGVISGTPTVQRTTTVTVRATDTFGNTGSTSFTWAVVVSGAPQLGSPGSLGGLGKGRPTLRFAVVAGRFAPPLKSVKVRLPGGLSFARQARSLAHGTTVRAESMKVPVSLKRRGGAVTIAFRSAATRASVTIAAPAIAVSTTESAKVRARTVTRVTVALKATDASGHTTSLRITLTKLS